MKIRQISVFIENEPGRLHELTRMLGNNNLNIRALSLADTKDFGIIRFIVNEPDKAYEILKKSNFSVGIHEVLAITIPDVPGGLANALEIFDEKKINVEYMYAFVNNSGADAIMVFRFDDTDLALEELKKTDINIIDEKRLYNI